MIIKAPRKTLGAVCLSTIDFLFQGYSLLKELIMIKAIIDF
jgi:type III secretory pathway component EscU